MKNLFLTISVLISSIFFSQNKDIIGIYSENLKLNPKGNYIELKSDSTFIYNINGKIYNGNWEFSQNKILLNPKIKKEFAKVRMRESKINSDSMTIKINYILKKENFDYSKNQNFRMATVYFDKKRNYINILKAPYIRTCGWAPFIRKQIILNNNNYVTVSQKDFSQIGFMTYNLKDYIVFTKNNKDSNFLEFDIEDVPEDVNIIKDEFFILDKNSLFYATKKGNKDLIQLPLVKKNR